MLKPLTCRSAVVSVQTACAGDLTSFDQSKNAELGPLGTAARIRVPDGTHVASRIIVTGFVLISLTHHSKLL